MKIARSDMYRLLFWVFFATTIALVVTGSMILTIRDRSFSYIFDILSNTVEQEKTHGYKYLPSYYETNLNDSLPYSFEKNVKSLEDFVVWKEGGVLESYASRPTIHEMDHFEPTEQILEDTNDHVLKKLTIPAFFDPDTVIFYELLPKGKATHDAVFIIPGSGNQGAKDVLGLPSEYSSHYYHGDIARHLVLEGYAVYTIELRGYGERQIDVGSACENNDPFTCPSLVLKNKLAIYGISIGNMRQDEISQILSWIESKKYIERIAVAGLSLGAGHAANTAIINPDVIDAVILASGIGSTLYSPLNSASGATLKLKCCDSKDAIATIAPTPMYVSFGLQESTFFRWEAETRHTADFLQGVYDLHQKSDNFYFIAHDGMHKYDVDSVIEFLNSHMG